MKEFLSEISVDERLSPEHHIALIIYNNCVLGNDAKFEDLRVTQDLVERFNEFINDENNLSLMEDLLQTYNIRVTTLMSTYYDTPWVYSLPIIWNDRVRDKYYEDNLISSHRFEVYLDHVFMRHGVDLGIFYDRNSQYHIGENNQGIEIKFDKKAFEGSPNLYIEYQERLNKKLPWTNSGILKDDNTNFILIGYPSKYWVLRKKTLIDIYNKLIDSPEGRLDDNCRLIEELTRGTSKGFLIPQTVADELTIDFEELIEEINR